MRPKQLPDGQAVSAPIAREAHQIWLTINAVLENRGLCKHLKNGGVRRVRFHGWTYRPEIRAFVFLVDTARLPIALEQLHDADVAHHISSALDGRHVAFTNSRGFAITIGRDLPAPKNPPIRLPRLVNLDLAQKPDGRYLVGLGVSRETPVWLSLERACHIMIGGSSDSGKSAMLRNILYQLMLMPEPVEVALSDLEGRTFGAFEGLPRIKLPVAGDVESATRITTWLLNEMERRGALFDATGYFVEDWPEYMAVPNVEPLPWIVAVFDEFSALLELAGKRSELYHHIQQLSMRSRKYGITMIWAGQDFKSELVGSLATNQVRTRIAFHCATRYHSESILGVPAGGAERLHVQGRAIALLGAEIVEIQGYWVPKDWLLALREREGIEAPVLTAGMTKAELDLFVWAVECNGSLMRIEDIAARADRLGIAPSAARNLAARWERLEWLEKRPPNNARYVTQSIEQRLRETGAFADASQTVPGVCDDPFAVANGRSG